MEFISANAGAKGNRLNPERGLVRHQFLEIFVRLSISKFIRTKTLNQPTKAMKLFFDEKCVNYLSSFNSHIWRRGMLWNEECDCVYKRYMPLVKKLYELHSGRNDPPGSTKYMYLDEFTDIFDECDLSTDHFGTREIITAFILSQ